VQYSSAGTECWYSSAGLGWVGKSGGGGFESWHTHGEFLCGLGSNWAADVVSEEDELAAGI